MAVDVVHQAVTLACTNSVGDPAELITAIDDANATPGPDVIELAAGCVYSFTTVNNYFYGPNALPVVASDLTIEGHGAIVERSGSTNMRLFYVASAAVAPSVEGHLTLREVTLLGGRAQGGSGYKGGTGCAGDTVIRRFQLRSSQL